MRRACKAILCCSLPGRRNALHLCQRWPQAARECHCAIFRRRQVSTSDEQIRCRQVTSHLTPASLLADLMLGANPMLDDSLNQDEPVFNRHIFSRSRPGDRRRSSAFADWGSPARSGRKRPRPRNPLNEDEDTQMTVSSRRCIRIGDSDAVWGFYEQRFKNCQQTACKLIAKAWVKAVEPKKQSTHPYTGSDEKAPDWWPKPWGPTKDDKVRHKEPDHLYKRGKLLG